MKPKPLLFGLTTSLLCAWHGAGAQQPPVDSPWEPNPTAWSAPTRPLAAPGPALPYGYLWQDYRGASVEHDLYGQRAQALWRPPATPRGILASLSCWLDSFLVVHHPPQKRSCCETCGAPLAAPIPPLLTDGAAEYSPNSLLEPAIPVPAPDIALEGDSPQQEPNRFVPLKEVEAPSIIAVPDDLNPVRPPVVELAPDVVLPPEPASPVPPRNRIPRPSGPPPRNAIPSR